MKTYMLAVFVGIALIVIVEALPLEESPKSTTADITTSAPFEDGDYYDEADEPVMPDDDDMEAAEVLVFRPLFSYRRVEAARRRKARRYPSRRQAGYWY
ncbi:hypothetical protein C0J52_12465 [Blattella germanica]|nr:hypothetical protein C0J52_12465 [Blattella germanica]